ncbi:hypothetical protein SDC9_172912 [bioreactor metagenome]|uniref:Uncharacterized protein n=1 Tax=bioreactor metagenome TaxID=1076179 RepID=A0A645GF11_9ZZZZ
MSRKAEGDAEGNAVTTTCSEWNSPVLNIFRVNLILFFFMGSNKMEINANILIVKHIAFSGKINYLYQEKQEKYNETAFSCDRFRIHGADPCGESAEESARRTGRHCRSLFSV